NFQINKRPIALLTGLSQPFERLVLLPKAGIDNRYVARRHGSSLREIIQLVDLAGVIAHELCHSYFEDEIAEAQRAKEARGMRVVELKCDAVAILSLKLLSYHPALYLRGLQRIQVIIKRKGRSNGIFQFHPELVVRAQFSQRFIKSPG